MGRERSDEPFMLCRAGCDRCVSVPPTALRLNDVRDGEGYENFCAVVLTVVRLEWLYLVASGHQRALCEWDAKGFVSANWIAP